VPVLLVIIGSRNCCRGLNIALLAVAAWKACQIKQEEAHYKGENFHQVQI